MDLLRTTGRQLVTEAGWVADTVIVDFVATGRPKLADWSVNCIEASHTMVVVTLRKQVGSEQ